jgi:hypothetical protein
MRDVGLELESILNAIKMPFGNFSRLGRFAGRKLGSLLASPSVSVSNVELEPEAGQLGRLIGSLGGNIERLLATYEREIVDRQYQLGRIADSATEIYASTCVLNRLDTLLHDHHVDGAQKRFELATARYYLTTARRRIKQNLSELWDNDDDATTDLADRMLK